MIYCLNFSCSVFVWEGWTLIGISWRIDYHWTYQLLVLVSLSIMFYHLQSSWKGAKFKIKNKTSSMRMVHTYYIIYLIGLEYLYVELKNQYTYSRLPHNRNGWLFKDHKSTNYFSTISKSDKED